MRQPVLPSTANGFAQRSYLLVDKLLTVPVARIGKNLGQLAPEDIAQLDQAMMVFLGLSG